MNAPPQAGSGTAEKLGFTAGAVVQEFGYDSDVDDDLRFEIEDLTGTELEDEDYGDVADAALIWWREEDGDLVDALVDALTNLEDGGFIVLLTPKAGRAGEIDMAEVGEAAATAGLHTSGSVNACPDWSATRLAAAKNRR
ncbi:MAG TPA: DUF3052 domain-containing protein [Intrasporangiaceae bacterium]|nr:DUF3052 domain-containing protein [Intrasporangiaceae bacterium]